MMVETIMITHISISRFQKVTVLLVWKSSKNIVRMGIGIA